MKHASKKSRVTVVVLLTFASAAFAQTTTTRGTPTISGFAPNPVSGHVTQPVTGFTPAPVQGLSSPRPVAQPGTIFTTGPIAPLSTTIAGADADSRLVVPPILSAPVSPIPVVSNAVETPLF